MAHKSGSQWAKIVTIVERIKLVAGELAVAVSEDNNLYKYGLDSAVTEKKQNVDAAKQKFVSMVVELDGIKKQVECAKKLLNDTNDEYRDLVENIKSLRETIHLLEDENSLRCQKLGDDTRTKLKLYKALTGVYFDFNIQNEDLIGFVAIERCNAQLNPALVPFEFRKSDSALSKTLLWNKIGEALQDTVQ